MTKKLGQVLDRRVAENRQRSLFELDGTLAGTLGQAFARAKERHSHPAPVVD